MLRVTIDQQAFEFPEGLRILEALQQTGKLVPHLCHDDRLQPQGACRLCVVEVEGLYQPVSSCSTPLQDGMVIHTHSPALEGLRRTNLSLLAKHIPHDALAATPQLPLHQWMVKLQVAAGDIPLTPVFHDDQHPYLGMDLSRCIQCDRCVRICHEVQGQDVWQKWGRGEHTHIAPRDGRSLASSGCVSCGACVDTCPSGALYDKQSQAATQWTRSTCVYCGVGCQMEVGTADGQVVAIRPADHPVNRGHLCVKGRYAFEFNHAPDRATHPMIRDGGEWRTVSWEEAFRYTADRMKAILQQHGPQALGVLGSARATNEENYLAQKFARVVLGTHNVDCCARVCHTPTAKAMKTVLGTGAATNCFDDIEQASLILVSGSNATENHPVVGARIRQAVRRGAKLIVIDPRTTKLAAIADVHLALRPGYNVPLLNAMAATLIEEGLINATFIEQRAEGLDALAALLKDYSPEAVADACGVPATTIRQAAHLYAAHAPAMCIHGLGMTEHTQGSEGVMTLINLALLTGNLGQPGSGINPLRGQNNVQGSAQMGCDPSILTGAQDIREAGPRFASLWGKALPTAPGLDLLEMLDAAEAGQFKALWVMGYDIYDTLANQARTGNSLAQLDLLIVQDIFLNETAREYGTVFFPAASVFERDGTFMNSDRRVQQIRACVPPPGEAQADWWIIQQLAQHMGATQGFHFANPEAIWNEIREVWPASGGLSYRRIASESLHWPCPDENHPGTPILHKTQFTHGPKAKLAVIPFVPSAEACTAEFPFLLNTGRTLYHFNAGTLTYRTANRQLRPADTLDIHPEDASRLGLGEKDWVEITSRYGHTQLPVRLTTQVKPGELFTTFHRPDLHVNRLTSNERDRLVHAPEYKITAVRLNKCPAAHHADQ